MAELAAILRCPRGEEWPAQSFKSFVDCKKKVQTHETITFMCPANHTFTLKRAVERGMFTPDQALKIIAEAQRQLPEARKEIRRLKKGGISGSERGNHKLPSLPESVEVGDKGADTN